MMLISVVIPTCHRNDLLAKCLDRLAPGVQTLPPEQYEVIVTDDGSKTTAEQMVREHYPWAKWVAGPRKGPAANRNNGTKFAQGEWVAFTDDDCLPAAHWLREFASAITSGTDVYEGKTTCEAGIHSPLYEAPINLTGGLLWSCNIMVGWAVFDELGGFDDSFPYNALEDVDFRERAKRAGYTSLFVPAASVDHPPRKRALGCHAAKIWKAHIHHWHKDSLPHPRRLGLIIHIVKVRLRSILDYPLGRDSAVVLLSLLGEVWCVLTHEAAWEDKSRRFHHSRIAT